MNILNSSVYIGLCTIYIFIISVSSRAIRHSARTSTGQQEYLRRYGYLSEGSQGGLQSIASISDGSNTGSMRDAIRKFQKMTGLPMTGIMNEATMRMMERPRCGVKDFDSERRTKRYVVADYKWNKNRLSYKIHHYTPDLSRNTVKNVIKNAFKKWSDKANLSFKQNYWFSSDIDVIFAAGEHCNHPGHGFDGQGGTLAHAFFPIFGGDIHFDEDEKWSTDVRHGTNLLEVATHEIGHALGLKHSENKDAIMAPIYKGHTNDIELHSDDIAGIRLLYGAARK